MKNAIYLLFLGIFFCFPGCINRRINTNPDTLPQSLPIDESHRFENQEFYFVAYFLDLRSPPFRFSFYDGIFRKDIPERDHLLIELGFPIKETIQGEYTITSENEFVFLTAAGKKYLVLYYRDLICVLIDLENNDTFFGVNRNSRYADTSSTRGRVFIGISGRSPWERDTRVSSFMTKTIGDRVIKFNGFSRDRYYFELSRPWIEGSDGQGTGEWIETKPVGVVSSIMFFNGYINPNRPDLFFAYSRAKEVLITAPGNSWTFELKDTPHPQILPLSPDGFNNEFRLTIMDIYEGSMFSNTSIAGIYFLRIPGL